MSILVVAAHPDDEVLGCGGTLARMADDGERIHVMMLADGESSRCDKPAMDSKEVCDARNRSAEKACEILGVSTIDSCGFPDNRMDTVDLLDVVKAIESIVEKYKPSTVLTHHLGDVNVDHRITHDAVLAACRPQPDHSVKELWFYEISSSTEWNPAGSHALFNPNLYVDITATLPRKIKALQAYHTELRDYPHTRSLKAVECLANYRGASVGVHAAEAFVLGRKIL